MSISFCGLFKLTRYTSVLHIDRNYIKRSRTERIKLIMNKSLNRPQRKRSNNAKPSNRRKATRATSDLDPRLLIKKGKLKVTTPYQSKLLTENLPLNSSLVQRLTKKGFKQPTEIQEKTLQPLLAGHNLLGIAQTGTGKTGAFLIPVIQQLLNKQQVKSFALVVVPTRELALQVIEEFKSMTKGLGLYASCFIGGTNINKDIQQLKRESHLIVATPGRLLDLRQQRALDLRKFKVLILDEFDRMLDMGFAKDVERIINLMPGRKQTMLFSATLNEQQRKSINEILGKHQTVKVTSGLSSTDQVDQDIVPINSQNDRFEKLISLLNDDQLKKVIVFSETKHQVNKLCTKLNKSGVRSAQIQGNKSQNARQKALADFKSGRVRVLVATDVAGRGIDVQDVSHVINYQLPMTYESYIHRIGRTGRAGKRGTALTFVEEDNRYLIKEPVSHI